MHKIRDFPFDLKLAQPNSQTAETAECVFKVARENVYVYRNVAN